MNETDNPRLVLVAQLERNGRLREALAIMQEEARAGDAHAYFMLGVRSMGARAAQRARAADLLRTASSRGHAEAQRLLSVLEASAAETVDDWRQALDALTQAAAMGSDHARREIALLGAAGDFDPAAWVRSPAPRVVFDAPRVSVTEGFLATAVCDWIVGFARSKPQQRVEVVDPTTGAGRVDHGRTNTGTYFGLSGLDVVTCLVKARIGAALGMAVRNQEDMNVLHYDPGQAFHQHCDFLDPEQSGHAQEIAAIGQRVATFLIYLNDDYKGGETDFPMLSWRYRGGKGDALVFWNVSPQGRIERKLLHAGLPPTSGEKWLLSQWVRDRPVQLI